MGVVTGRGQGGDCAGKKSSCSTTTNTTTNTTEIHTTTQTALGDGAVTVAPGGVFRGNIGLTGESLRDFLSLGNSGFSFERLQPTSVGGGNRTTGSSSLPVGAATTKKKPFKLTNGDLAALAAAATIAGVFFFK